MIKVSPMAPHCAAMHDYWAGVQQEPLRIIRSDGYEDVIPVDRFFDDELGDGDRQALDRCLGRVLDVGAGAGRHSLYLQAVGHEVYAIDVCSELVSEVLPRRGVRSVEQADIYSYSPKRSYDTILLLGHGLGLAGSLAGLEVLLDRCAQLVRWGGIVIADSLEVSVTEAQVHLTYQENLLRAGRYRGEMSFHLEYGELVGEEFDWLHVDIGTLATVADCWDVELIWEDEAGNYVAKISNPQPAAPRPG